MEIRNQIEYRVYGRYALFTDPVNRMGGEKLTYLVPTYQALKGVTESIYWKPSVMIVVDEVRIINPIKTESKNIRPISYSVPKNTLSIYTYLCDIEYEVKAHYIANPYRTDPELIADGKQEAKHYSIAKRMVKKGGRRDIYLGTRECQAYVEPCVFGEKKSFYQDRGEVDLGIMFHGFNYPDETGKDEFGVRLWHARMVNGVIHFPTPQECDPKLYRKIRPMKAKTFSSKVGNFSGLNETELE